MRRSFLCPDVLKGCTHTMVVNRRGEIIGCAEYVPNGLTAWQASERLDMAASARQRAYAAREERRYMSLYATPNQATRDDMRALALDSEQWEHLAAWLDSTV